MYTVNLIVMITTIHIVDCLPVQNIGKDRATVIM